MAKSARPIMAAARDRAEKAAASAGAFTEVIMNATEGMTAIIDAAVESFGDDDLTPHEVATRIMAAIGGSSSATASGRDA